jgi:hypothetical protein
MGSHPIRTGILAALAALALLAAGCGGDDDDAETSTAAPSVGNCSSPGANAHVQRGSGACERLETDNREGTPPPSLELTDLAAAAKAAGCDLREDLPDEGNDHVPDNEPVDYKTNPPTSGNHNQVPIADGAYVTPLNMDTARVPNVRNYVHSLEHGRVEIQYSQELPEPEQLAIKGVFDEEPAGMLLFPNNEMPYAVAATAWTALLGCPDYSPAALDALRDFRDKYRGNGPEAVPLNL